MAVKSSNLQGLLSRLGRSSTPEVKNSPFGITLGSITNINELNPGDVLLISTHATIRELSDPHKYAFGVPGMLIEQAQDHRFKYLIIDSEAFDQGPWLGSDNGGNKHLADEIFTAGGLMRKRGAIVFFIPRHQEQKANNGPEIPRIMSTCTVDLSDIPELDLEEQAPQTQLFNDWTEIARKRDSDGN